MRALVDAEDVVLAAEELRRRAQLRVEDVRGDELDERLEVLHAVFERRCSSGSR